jgi:hypothetical protein
LESEKKSVNKSINKNNNKNNDIIYKYLSCKIKNLKNKKEKFKNCDVIITNFNIFFMDYNINTLKFEFKFNVEIKNLRKLAFSKNTPNCIMLFDNKELIQGIEIKTESNASLLTLLDDLFHSHPESLKN